MRYTICTHCKAIFSYRKSTCPSCQTHHDTKEVKRIKLCPRDGTPIPVHSLICSACKLPVRGIYVPWWFWLSCITVVSLVTTILLTSLLNYVHTTYHPASCMVHSAKIGYDGKASNANYYIIWNYTAIGDNGQQMDSGEDRMGLGNYDSQYEAEQVVRQYYDGAEHSCWYSPVAFLTRARFALSDTAANIAAAVWLWLLGTAAILFTIGVCIIKMIWCPWRAHKHGMSTIGTVIDYEMQFVPRAGVFEKSTIHFSTQTNPPLIFYTKIRAALRKRQQVRVFYDPLHPAETARVGSPLSRREMLPYILCGLPGILLSLGIFSMLVVMAFALG